ncbi:hypothetical protein D3C72_1060350 [compost metagenome]
MRQFGLGRNDRPSRHELPALSVGTTRADESLMNAIGVGNVQLERQAKFGDLFGGFPGRRDETGSKPLDLCIVREQPLKLRTALAEDQSGAFGREAQKKLSDVPAAFELHSEALNVVQPVGRWV